MKLFATLSLAALMLLACAANAAPPAAATAVDFVQYATLGPADALQIPAGGDAVVQLDKGHIAGAEVLASDGLIRARGTCRVLLASADVEADGSIRAHLEVGERGDPAWAHVAGRKNDQVPLVPVFVPPGEWIRLRVFNLSGRAITIEPGTRVSVVALDCNDPSPPVELRQPGGWARLMGSDDLVHERRPLGVELTVIALKPPVLTPLTGLLTGPLKLLDPSGT